jgi:hypothetical protein
MDAAVAEALGYECVCDEEPLDCPIHCDDDPWTKRRYSTDIAAAWQPIEILRDNGKHVTITLPVGQGLEVWVREIIPLGLSDGLRTVADSLPLVICRAFLKANGVKYIEVPE